MGDELKRGERDGEPVAFSSTGKFNLLWKTLLKVFSAFRARVGLNREREQHGGSLQLKVCLKST